jgi:serine/threonine protein kinase/TPR repeat protein
MQDIDAQIYPDIPGFDIHAELGRGGIATVYLAVQKSLDRRVALKVMSPILAVEPDYAERFVREGRTIAKLNHTNIITVYDIGVQQHKLYIAMEHIPAGNLRNQLDAHKGDADWALAVAGQMAQALGYAHRHGVIHRDVKPENILFRENGVAVLTDFGIAKTVTQDTTLTRAGAVVGTPRYMSPEQTDGLGNDPQTDIYSLGVVLFEMLTGRVPYESENSMAVLYAHVHSPIPKLPQGLHDLQPLVDKMLAKKPEDRPSDCDQLAEIIRLTRRERHHAIRDADPGSPAESLRDTLEFPAASEPLQPASTSLENQPGPVRRVVAALSNRPAWQTIGVAAILLVILFTWIGSTTILDAPTREPLAMQEETESVTTEDAGQPDPTALPMPPAGEDMASELPPPPPTARQKVILSEFLADQTETGATNKGVTPSGNQLAHPRQAEIDALLVKAKKAVEQDRLHYPKADNAIDWYQAVLEIDPSNARARRGLQVTADLLREKAIGLNSKDAPDLALVMIAAGLRASPGDPELTKLRTTINQSFTAAGSFIMAEQFYHGKDVKQSMRRAAFYYRKAAALGNPRAMNALGVMYAEGTGVARSEEKAMAWFRKAANENDAEAMYNLALGYLFGEQPATDSALPLASAASSLEYRPAYRLVGWMYTTGTGAPASNLQAFRWDLKGMVNPIGDKLSAKLRNPKDWQKAFDEAYKKATNTGPG